MKIFSTLLVIREMKTETSMGYHFTPNRMNGKNKKSDDSNVTNNVEQLELSHIANRIVKWHNLFEKVWQLQSQKCIYSSTLQNNASTK